MIDVEGIEHEAFVKNIIPEQSFGSLNLQKRNESKKKRTMTSSRIRIAALLSWYNLYFFFQRFFLKFLVSRNLIELKKKKKKNVRCIFVLLKEGRGDTLVESNAWFIAQGRTIYNTTKGRKIGKRTVTFFFVYLQLSTSCPSSLIFPNKFPLGREFHRKKRFFFGSFTSIQLNKGRSIQ